MSTVDMRKTDPPVAPDADAVTVTEANRVEQVTRLLREQGGVAVLVVVFLAASIFSSGFFDTGNLESILVGNAYVSLLALGMTFVIISGGIDLSVGSVFALGGVLAAYGVNHGGGIVAVLLAVGVSAAWGLVQGLLIAKARLAPFIVTLAGMLGARGLLQAITDQGSKTYTVPKDSWFINIGNGTWVPIITVVVLFVLGAVVLLRTRYGQSLFAIGGNENAAVLMGLPVLRNKVLVYVLSATLAGSAGALNASRLQSGVTNIGVGYELTAIAAVIIGGTLLSGGAGSVSGTAAGVLLLAIMQNLIGVHLSKYGSSASDAVNGGFLAVVVILQTLLTRAERIE
ncbi:ABC transporter permease [uncultured Jatrophihabitans sp.]|uniref:ABC transporter permease n=1 Tax=uncultured Jatrophihabitans sp. TaxID=1610747 RepID=UPI0035CA9DC9